MSYVVERIAHEPTSVGEGPHWDEEKELLYFVDIPNGSILSYDPKTKKVSKAVIGDGETHISIVIPVEGETDKYLISYNADVALVRWDGVSDSVTDFEILASTPNPDAVLRFNDGKCAPSGTFFAGTMEINYNLNDPDAPGKGAFYAIKNRTAKKLFDGAKISNGLAWSADESEFYFIDSLLYRIDRFDYDAKNIELKNRRTVFDLKANQIPGVPDGLAIDRDGNLWVAIYRGSRVIQINPATGKLLNTIQLPTPLITSVAFGGRDLDELYVTSACRNIDEKKDPDAGHLFKVTGLGTVGLPGKRVTI